MPRVQTDASCGRNPCLSRTTGVVYGRESRYSQYPTLASGALLSIFNDRLKRKDRFIGVRIDEKEDVYPALKQFFGKKNEL